MSAFCRTMRTARKAQPAVFGRVQTGATRKRGAILHTTAAHHEIPAEKPALSVLTAVATTDFINALPAHATAAVLPQILRQTHVAFPVSVAPLPETEITANTNVRQKIAIVINAIIQKNKYQPSWKKTRAWSVNRAIIRIVRECIVAK